MLADIVERIAALEFGDVLKLNRDEIVEEFGRGPVGVACLQEMAEDHDCRFEVGKDAVSITKF